MRHRTAKRLIWGAMLAHVWVASLARAAELDKQELFSRLQYAGHVPFTAAAIVAKEKYLHNELRNPDPNPDKATEQYTQNLQRRIASGSLELTVRQRDQLQAKYGTADYTTLLGNPEVRTMVDLYIQQQATTYRSRISAPKATHELLSTNFWTVDFTKGARLEKALDKYLVSGKEDPSAPGHTDIDVINGETRKHYADRLTYGRIEHGMTKDPRKFVDILGYPPVTAAGRPAIGHFQIGHMTSATQEQTPDGDALKVVFEVKANEGEPPGTTTVFWVLPDKGYMLHKSEYYVGGKLIETQSHGDYREVEPGLWYPMKQTREQYRSELSAEVTRQLASGELRVDSPGARAAQKSFLYLATYRQVQRMQPGVTVPDELLTVSFPNGTLVDDQTVGGNKPLQYVVGGPKPPTKLDQVATGSNRSDGSKVDGTEQSTNASNAPAAAGHAAASNALAATEHTTGAAGVLRAKLPWPISLTHIVLVALAAATLVACLAWRHTRRRGHSQS